MSSTKVGACALKAKISDYRRRVKRGETKQEDRRVELRCDPRGPAASLKMALIKRTNRCIFIVDTWR
jgi:hypothetical protein